MVRPGYFLENNAPNENPSGLGQFVCNMRYPGQYFDKETNLHYNYFRDYDPATGRYIQSDPIGLEGGTNTFAYVLNNPLIGFDPLGLLTILGCDPAQKRQLEIAAGKASAAANTSCVSCEDRPELKRRIDNLVIQCTTYSTAVGPNGREVPFCGGVRRGNPTLFISPLAFTNPKCGCLQSLVLHESAHTLTTPYTDDPNDPRNADNLARRCFKCAP